MKSLSIRPNEYIVILTGAGISAESGIPTFRDKDGIWQRYDLREVATFQGFLENPEKVWRFYSERRKHGLQCSPNPGHLAIAEFEKRHPGKFTLITQNVDGLHGKAGSKNILEVHGSLYRTKCSNNRCDLATMGFEDFQSYDTVPKCPQCQSNLRPDVVWFGEYLDPTIERSARVAVSMCDIFVAVGTSGVVWPVAGYVEIAKAKGARTILVNLEPPANKHMFDEFYMGKAGEILPALLC